MHKPSNWNVAQETSN